MDQAIPCDVCGSLAQDVPEKRPALWPIGPRLGKGSAMNDLPPNHKLGQREVFDMVLLRGLESVTRSLRTGDGFSMENLRPLAQRCRALSDAFDARMKEHSAVLED